MRQRFAAWGGGVAGALLLLGVGSCAPAPAPETAPSAPAAPVGAAAPVDKPQPKQGGVLVYSCTTAPVNLNVYVSNGPAEERTLGTVYETLFHLRHELDVDYRIDYEVLPWLVERWESRDPKTFILSLRKGVKWHDGQEFTADDVEFSVRYGMDPANNFRARSLQFRYVDSAKVLDRYTVQLNAKQAVPDFISALGDRGAFIMPKHVLDRGDDFKKVAVGTGPFKLKDFDPNQGSLVVKNPDYWQAGRPFIDGIRCQYGMQAQHETAAFVAGQLDILHANDRVQLQTLQRSAQGLQSSSITVQSGLAILPKLSKKPFDDVRVRKAIHLAVDRQGLKAAALFGDGVINPPGMPGDKPGWAIPQEELLTLPGYRQPKEPDIAEGKRLMAEAGLAGGLKTTMLYGTNLTLGVRVAEPLQAQLAKIGLEVTLRPLPIAEARAEEEKGAFELLVQNTADHEIKYQYEQLHSKGTRYNDIDDQVLDALLDRAAGSLDLADRKKAGLEMQRLLLEKNYIVPTIAPLSFPMWQRWVFDYVPEPSNVNRMTRSQGYRIWMDVEKMPPDRR